MSLADNPVERLELIILRMRDVAGGTTLLFGLLQSLNVSSTEEVMRGASRLLTLPDEARAAVRSVNSDSFYTEWYDPVVSAVALTQNLDSYCQNFQDLIGPDSLGSIRAAARICSSSHGEGHDVRAEIAEMRAQCDTLRQVVVDANDLPPQLKRFLLAQVERLSLALSEFVVRGGAAVEDVSDAVVGAIIRATNAFPDSEWPEASKPVMQKLLSLVDAFGKVATTTTALLLLPSAVSDAIGFIP